MTSKYEPNPQYARGQMQAAYQEALNVRGEFSALLKGFGGIARQAYDNPPNSWDRYVRAYHRLRLAAERCASLGDDVSIPAQLPENPEVIKMVKVEAPKENATYKETRGMGKEGKGLPSELLLTENLAWLEGYQPGTTKPNQ